MTDDQVYDIYFAAEAESNKDLETAVRDWLMSILKTIAGTEFKVGVFQGSIGKVEYTIADHGDTNIPYHWLVWFGNPDAPANAFTGLRHLIEQ